MARVTSPPRFTVTTKSDLSGAIHAAILAETCQMAYVCTMSTMNISLPVALKAFVDEQVSQGGYSTRSEYLRELICKDRGCLQLRGLLLAGAASAPATPVDAAWFDRLRDDVRRTAKSGAQE